MIYKKNESRSDMIENSLLRFKKNKITKVLTYFLTLAKKFNASRFQRHLHPWYGYSNQIYRLHYADLKMASNPSVVTPVEFALNGQLVLLHAVEMGHPYELRQTTDKQRRSQSNQLRDLLYTSWGSRSFGIYGVSNLNLDPGGYLGRKEYSIFFFSDIIPSII